MPSITATFDGNLEPYGALWCPHRTTPTTKQMTTYTKTLGNPRFFAPADRIKVRITREERDAINAANAARYCATPAYEGNLFEDMFGA